MSTGSILIVGVGGQGVLLAGDVLATVCLMVGLDVKKSEVHGMAQRGGIVFSHVRFGPSVHSPLVEEGQADAVVALEWAEALRWATFLRPGGVIIADAARIVPPAACDDRRTWRSSYPPLEPPQSGDGPTTHLIEARTLAKAAGVARAANIVLLGALSTRLDFPADTWAEAIRRLLPARLVEANLRAFAAGQRAEPLSVPVRPAPVGADAIRGGPAPSGRGPGPAQAGARRFAVEVIAAWCKGCDICVRLCPEDILRLDADGVVRVTVPERCTGCRLCEWLCPDFAITVRAEGAAARG